MISAVNDRNIVDDSVKNVINSIPTYVSRMSAIFCKYGKLINQKYLDLAQSDERRRIKGVNDVSSLLKLTFDKLLFALDRDAYIDFLNEIKTVDSDMNFYDCSIYCHPEENIEGVTYPVLEQISSVNLIHPSTGVKTITSCDYDGVPLIKLTPCVHLNTGYKRHESYEANFVNFWNDDTNNYGIGIDIKTVKCEIDICSLFESMHHIMLRQAYKEKIIYNHHDSKIEPSDFDILNETSTNCLEAIDEELTQKLIYSITTTYLALITKLNDFTVSSTIDMLFENILDSCRKTVLDNYDSHGNDIKTGMGLRHMTIDISTLLNSILYSTAKGFNNEYCILAKMIEYGVSLQYVTYNYSLIPFNNLKHKKLMNISKVAKNNVYLLNPDTRCTLQTCVKNKDTFEGFFCSKSDLIIDGTYSFNKRLYDTTKDFIDVFAKFIIIKKRMYDAGAFNVSDGTTDNIGKRYIDYKNYMKNTYEELKVSLTNIFNRIKNVTIGKRYLSANIAVKASDNEVIRNLNTIVFGITSEAVLDSTYDTHSLFEDEYYNMNKHTDYSNHKRRTYDANEIVTEIRHIYEVLKQRECTYSNNSTAILNAVNNFGNGSLVTFWIAVNESCGDFFEIPFNGIANQISSISLGYAESSINEMAPKQEYTDSVTSGQFISEWGQKDLHNTYKSVEDLRESFEELKEKVEKHEGDNESVFGGLLFGDFGGVPLAHDMTAKETEIYNDQLSVRTIPDSEVEAFEDLKHEFDAFIAKHL